MTESSRATYAGSGIGLGGPFGSRMVQAVGDVGYYIIDGLLSGSECDRLAAALSIPGAQRGRAGSRHLMTSSEVASLASDSRLLRIARELLGGEATPFHATSFEKTSRANWLVVWHQDTALPLASRFTSNEWGPWSVKAGILYAHAPAWALDRVVALRVHLDASTLDNGPLKVIPGSHCCGVLPDEDVFRTARESDSVECVVGRGGVLAMKPLLIHSSSKALVESPRRVIHIEYSDEIELRPGIRLAVA